MWEGKRLFVPGRLVAVVGEERREEKEEKETDRRAEK
jgi:hypothetical protein